MPNKNTEMAQKLVKGDVIWVPYRKDPFWPALVNNVYSKKVTFSFFPLSDDEILKKSRFSCAPKLTYAFSSTESLPENSDPPLKSAFKAACKYLSEKGKTRGAEIPTIEEALEKEKNVEKKMKIEERRKRKISEKVEKEEKDDDDEDSQPASKKPATSSSERASPVPQLEPISVKQSKEMMELIDGCLDSLIEECLKSEKVASSRNESLFKNGEFTVKLKNNQFLTELDYDSLFERILLNVRKSDPSISFISSFNITASHIIPKVLIKCYSTWKSVDLKVANAAFYQKNGRVFGLDRSVSIPVTNNLEELCRLACDESEAIQKN